MIKLLINGDTHEIDADPDMPLLWVLRDLLSLTGTKFGCGIAMCGACTILLDGKPVRSCVTTVKAAEDTSIFTIEGLGIDTGMDKSKHEAGSLVLHPVQRAWIDEQVPQCGFCQSGQIMAAVALLDNNLDPSDSEINDAMAGIICRCGTYQRVRKAIKRAAQIKRDIINGTQDMEGLTCE